MKKTLKIPAIILAVVMMCLSFSGCAQLDDMKATQAFWTQSGNAGSITYNDVEYVLIKNTKGHNVNYQNTEKMVYVTESDVPALLSRDKGTFLDISLDGNFISGLVYDEYAKSVDKIKEDTELFHYDTNVGREVVYCKKDIYDDVIASIESGVEYTGYGYLSNYNDSKDNIIYTYTYLTDEQVKLLEKVIDDANLFDHPFSSECSYIANLDHISEDKYFGKSMYEVYWLDMGVGEYYLYCNEPDGDKELIYAVPLKYSEEFDIIFKDVHLYNGKEDITDNEDVIEY